MSAAIIKTTPRGNKIRTAIWEIAMASGLSSRFFQQRGCPREEIGGINLHRQAERD